MADRDHAIVQALLDRHGTTFATQLGIPVEKGTPSPLFRLLCASLLFSARISADLAVRAARALHEQRWDTPERLCAASWRDRTDVLNAAGYARYDERTSTMLGQTAERLIDAYGGDLRRLREHAGRDPGEERRRLKEFQGIGDVGADIYLREAQAAWGELRPFADRRALETARDLGLPADAARLAELVPEHEVARLVAALVRTRLERDLDGVRAAAGA